jgi:hypothetical protein
MIRSIKINKLSAKLSCFLGTLLLFVNTWCVSTPLPRRNLTPLTPTIVRIPAFPPTPKPYDTSTTPSGRMYTYKDIQKQLQCTVTSNTPPYDCASTNAPNTPLGIGGGGNNYQKTYNANVPAYGCFLNKVDSASPKTLTVNTQGGQTVTVTQYAPQCAGTFIPFECTDKATCPYYSLTHGSIIPLGIIACPAGYVAGPITTQLGTFTLQCLPVVNYFAPSKGYQ